MELTKYDKELCLLDVDDKVDFCISYSAAVALYLYILNDGVTVDHFFTTNPAEVHADGAIDGKSG